MLFDKLNATRHRNKEASRVQPFLIIQTKKKNHTDTVHVFLLEPDYFPEETIERILACSSSARVVHTMAAACTPSIPVFTDWREEP